MGAREKAAEEKRGGWATPTVQFRFRNCGSFRKKEQFFFFFFWCEYVFFYPALIDFRIVLLKRWRVLGVWERELRGHGVVQEQ